MNRDQVKDYKAPLTLHDSLNMIKKIYIDVSCIKTLTGRLMRLLTKCNQKKKGHRKATPEDFRNMQPNVKAEDFVKLLTNGTLLIKSFQIQMISAEELRDAEAYLKHLRLHVENEFEADIPKFPTIQKTEVHLDHGEFRQSGYTNRAYVSDYIKKHFPDFADYSTLQVDLHFAMGYTLPDESEDVYGAVK